MSSRRNSVEDDLRKQLLQEQRDKMVLLDQLAMVKVSICFHCQNDLPPMETRLQQTLDRRAARLNKLREKLVRVSHDLRTEECVLHNTEEELRHLKKESSNARHLIEREEQRARELKLAFEQVVREKREIIAKKEIELERTEELKSEIEHLQENNYACQIQCDLVCTAEAVREMQEQLRLLVDEKNSLDTEVYTINEYLIVKRQELEEAKQALDSLRKEEDALLKRDTTKLELQKQIREQMANAEDQLHVIKKKIKFANEEREAELEALAAEKEAIEELKRQVEMCKSDVQHLKATKSSVMQENLEAKHHLQEAQREMKILHEQKVQLTKKLAASKADLEESQRLLESCLQHQKESQDAVSSMKNRMLSGFTRLRKELRTLQEDKMRVSKEINKLKNLNRAGGTSIADDYQLKELVDHLIDEITRATPAENLQYVVSHIQACFSEYLRKHDEHACVKQVEFISTADGCHLNCEDCPCSSRGSSRICFWLDETSSESADVKDKKSEPELPNTTEIASEIMQSSPTKRALVESSEENQQASKSRELLSECRDSLQDLFQGALSGIKDPYPDLKQ